MVTSEVDFSIIQAEWYLFDEHVAIICLFDKGILLDWLPLRKPLM